MLIRLIQPLILFQPLIRCNKEISDSCKVWVQCPIENINIFTPNNDGVNDFFIPINLDQYPNPTLIVYNRWGQIVFYENENYQNDWEGTHYQSGDQLTKDFYYYFITPESKKFNYKDINISSKGKEPKSIIGQVQIIRN